MKVLVSSSCLPSSACGRRPSLPLFLVCLCVCWAFVCAGPSYSPVEKLCLCLYFSCTRLWHYLLSNECTVICKADVVKYMLSAPILK